jgi:catechol 2,3-dioxygenase-like lactoylglutathione lyase family enzyme
LVPEPKEPGVISICAGHGPVYFVESTAPEADEEHRLRRSGLSSCQEGLAEPFAVEIALLAADVIPACAELDEQPFPAVAEQLRACATLSGDAVAAARVYNLMRPLLADRPDRPSAEQLKPLLELAQVDGAGAGAGLRPEQAWLQALAGEGRPEFVVERAHAPNADRVEVEGVIRRRHSLENDDDYPRDRGRGGHGAIGVDQEHEIRLRARADDDRGFWARRGPLPCSGPDRAFSRLLRPVSGC